MSSQGPSAPRWVGAYELLGRVATSATGSVWRGRDHALGRYVALKQVAGGAVRSVEQLRAEAQVLARLSHPNIVGVIDLVEAPDALWLVEEWVEGLTLSAVLRLAGRFSAIQAVGAVRGGLLGLDYAHSNRVVHGDVSPANLLLDLGGTTRLVDFGLAQPAGATGVTGTPGYLSPEAAGGLPVLPASDVYSAAAVLMLLLRGRPLFEGPTAEAVLAAQFRPGVPDLRGVDAPIRTVLQAALAPAPADRPANAGQLLELLDEAAERTFGAGWLAGASVVGLVSAAATAAATAGVAATAGAPAAAPGTALIQGPPLVPGPSPVQPPPVQAQPAAYQTAHPAMPSPVAPSSGATSPDRGERLGRNVRRVFRSHRLLAIVGGVAVVTAAAVIVAQHHQSPARPVAATRPPVTTIASTPSLSSSQRTVTPSVTTTASIEDAICAAVFPNGVPTPGHHCAVNRLIRSTADPSWVYAQFGLYTAQNQLDSDEGRVIFNLNTHQMIGPTPAGFCGEGTNTNQPTPGYSSVPAAVLADFHLSSCSPATSFPNVGFASLAGTWRAHELILVITNAGSGHLTYPDLAACPSCSEATAPPGTLDFTLTSATNGVAAGRVTASSDLRTWKLGLPVRLTLTAGSPGQLLQVNIGGIQLIAFCNGSSAGQCGA